VKILIVDDNVNLASIIQMMLEAEGYEVQKAQNGAEGYLNYLLFEPDLVLTDLQMPEKNGLELMKHIRVHNPGVRTIYMSGDFGRYWGLVEEEEERYRVGVLEKPFSRAELMSMLSKHFSEGTVAPLAKVGMGR
jgi:CheY-like chemotaxis protein